MRLKPKIGVIVRIKQDLKDVEYMLLSGFELPVEELCSLLRDYGRLTGIVPDFPPLLAAHVVTRLQKRIVRRKRPMRLEDYRSLCWAKMHKKSDDEEERNEAKDIIESFRRRYSIEPKSMQAILTRLDKEFRPKQEKKGPRAI